MLNQEVGTNHKLYLKQLKKLIGNNQHYQNDLEKDFCQNGLEDEE